MELLTFLRRLSHLPEGSKEDVFDTLNSYCDGNGDETEAVTEIVEIISRCEERNEPDAINKVVVCTDNSHTWRNRLTIGKEYVVLRSYHDRHCGDPMVEIQCDDGSVSVYRADRFEAPTLHQ